MDHHTIRLLRHDPVALVRLHRPERMNAVIEQMYLELQDALAMAAAAEAVRAVVLTGSPLVRDGVTRPAFCAGADLKAHAAGTRTAADQRRYITLAHDTVARMIGLGLPIVAAVDGPARGAGTELALACDLVLMTPEATLGLPEIGLGTFVGGGVTHLLPRLVGLQRARELVYTGRVVAGPEAVELGLALRCVPRERLLEEALALAAELAAKAPVSMALARRHLLEAPGRSLREALAAETEAILECMATDDWHEGHRAFAERRPPRFTGR
jgi:enoyl-CoA hydratase